MKHPTAPNLCASLLLYILLLPAGSLATSQPHTHASLPSPPPDLVDHAIPSGSPAPWGYWGSLHHHHQQQQQAAECKWQSRRASCITQHAYAALDYPPHRGVAVYVSTRCAQPHSCIAHHNSIASRGVQRAVPHCAACGHTSAFRPVLFARFRARRPRQGAGLGWARPRGRGRCAAHQGWHRPSSRRAQQTGRPWRCGLWGVRGGGGGRGCTCVCGEGRNGSTGLPRGWGAGGARRVASRRWGRGAPLPGITGQRRHARGAPGVGSAGLRAAGMVVLGHEVTAVTTRLHRMLECTLGWWGRAGWSSILL